MLKDVLATRRAFHNWIEVGIIAGMAVESRIPPRLGWERLGRRRIRFRTRMGPILETEAGNASAIVEVFRNGEYNAPLAWENLRFVLDVGAHVGSFTCWVSALAPRAHIVALEPEPQNFSDLLRNVIRNRINDRVTLLNVAAASKTGHRSLGVPIRRECASLVAVDASSPRIQVETLDLDEYLRQDCPDVVDLLKMDCEGAEWEILGSLTPEAWKRIDQLFLECHSLGTHDIQSMEGILDRAGLTRRTISKAVSGPAQLGDLFTVFAGRDKS